MIIILYIFAIHQFKIRRKKNLKFYSNGIVFNDVMFHPQGSTLNFQSFQCQYIFYPIIFNHAKFFFFDVIVWRVANDAFYICTTVFVTHFL